VKDKGEKTRFDQLVSGPSLRGLHEAERFLINAMNLTPEITPKDLLKPGTLYHAIWKLANIDGWIPVRGIQIHGYTSWLGRWRRCGQAMVIAIDANILRDVRATRFVTADTRAQAKFLAIVAHEVGHIVMRSPATKEKFVEDMGIFVGADWQTLQAEGEAWLFAGFLRAFVFADIGGEKRPDKTHMYV
jgi:hypothetical protein